MGEKPDGDTVKVPDFTGMNRAQATETAGKLGLYILSTGNSSLSPQTVVTGQSIGAGEWIKRGSTINLEFTDTTARD